MGPEDWVQIGNGFKWDDDVHDDKQAKDKYGDKAKDVTENGQPFNYTHQGIGYTLNPNGSFERNYSELSQGTQTTDGSLEALQAGINSMSAGLSLASGVAELTAYSLFPEAEGAVGTKAASEVSEAGTDGGVQYTKSNLALGREIHADYKLAEHAPELDRFKEFTGIRGIRPDFVDFGTKTIYELKPFNPRGIQMGTQQLNKYKFLFEQNYGGTWKTVLDHY
jgi:hypothetical protein